MTELNDKGTAQEQLSQLTNEELETKYSELHERLEIELSMDRSGELGGYIHESLRPHFEALEAEMEARGIFEEQFEFEEHGEDLPF